MVIEKLSKLWLGSDNPNNELLSKKLFSDNIKLYSFSSTNVGRIRNKVISYLLGEKSGDIRLEIPGISYSKEEKENEFKKALDEIEPKWKEIIEKINIGSQTYRNIFGAGLSDGEDENKVVGKNIGDTCPLFEKVINRYISLLYIKGQINLAQKFIKRISVLHSIFYICEEDLDEARSIVASLEEILRDETTKSPGKNISKYLRKYSQTEKVSYWSYKYKKLRFGEENYSFKKISKEISKKISKKISKEISKKISKEISKEISKKILRAGNFWEGGENFKNFFGLDYEAWKVEIGEELEIDTDWLKRPLGKGIIAPPPPFHLWKKLLGSRCLPLFKLALWDINSWATRKIEKLEQDIANKKIEDADEETIKNFLEVAESNLRLEEDDDIFIFSFKILSDELRGKFDALSNLSREIKEIKNVNQIKEKLENKVLNREDLLWREIKKEINDNYMLSYDHKRYLEEKLLEKVFNTDAANELAEEKKKVKELEDVVKKTIIAPDESGFSVSDKTKEDLEKELEKSLGGKEIAELPAELAKAQKYQNILDKVSVSSGKDKVMIGGDIDPEKIKSLLETSTSGSSSSDTVAAGNFYYIKSHLRITDTAGNIDNNLLDTYREVDSIFGHLGIRNWGELKSRLGGQPIQINIFNNLNLSQIITENQRLNWLHTDYYNVSRQSALLEEAIKQATGDSSAFGSLPTTSPGLQNYFDSYSGGQTIPELKKQADRYSRIKAEIPDLFQSDGEVNDTELETIKNYPSKINSILGITGSLPSDWDIKLVKREEFDRIQADSEVWENHECPPPCSLLHYPCPHQDYQEIKGKLENKEKEIVQKLNSSLKLELDKEEKNLDKAIEKLKKMLGKPPVDIDSIKAQLAESQNTIADLQKQLTAARQEKVIIAEKEKVIEIMKFVHKVLPEKDLKKFEVQFQHTDNYKQLKNVEEKLKNDYFVVKETQKKKLTNERVAWIYLLMINLLIIGGLILKLKSKKKDKTS